MITDAFPELIDEDVRVEFLEDEDEDFGSYGELHGGGVFVEIAPSLETAHLDLLQGILAHELSHAVLDYKTRVRFTLLERLYDWVAYAISERYRTLDERNTDLEIIKRGYGKQLLALLEYSENVLGIDYSPEKGLSPREVKVLLGRNSA